MDSFGNNDSIFADYRQLLAKGSILIIDDNREVHRILKLLLTQLKLSDIRSAQTGTEGLSIMRVYKVSLVICDFHLGDMTAVEVIKEMRMNQGSSFTPFLLVTSDVTKGEIMEAHSYGVSACILKPFTLELLEDKIIEAVDGCSGLNSSASLSQHEDS